MKIKNAHLFSVRLWAFWCEIPLVALLILSIIYNDSVTYTPFKLFPLMLFSVAGIILAFIYFFRLVRISLYEVRCIGLFSSKDSAMVLENRLIRFRLNRGGKIDIELIGNDGVLAGLDWLHSIGEAPRDISLFRAHAFGGRRALCRALRALGIDKESAGLLVSGPTEKIDFEYVSASSEQNADALTVSIRVTKTL